MMMAGSSRMSTFLLRRLSSCARSSGVRFRMHSGGWSRCRAESSCLGADAAAADAFSSALPDSSLRNAFSAVESDMSTTVCTSSALRSWEAIDCRISGRGPTRKKEEKKIKDGCSFSERIYWRVRRFLQRREYLPTYLPNLRRYLGRKAGAAHSLRLNIQRYLSDGVSRADAVPQYGTARSPDPAGCSMTAGCPGTTQYNTLQAA